MNTFTQTFELKKPNLKKLLRKLGARRFKPYKLLEEEVSKKMIGYFRRKEHYAFYGAPPSEEEFNKLREDIRNKIYEKIMLTEEEMNKANTSPFLKKDWLEEKEFGN